MKTYKGLCLIIVKAEKSGTGSFTVKADSIGLKGATVKVGITN